MWSHNIQRWIDEEGWNQKILAEKAGVSSNLITTLVAHGGNPRMSTFVRVLMAFNAARRARGAEEIALWQIFAPADLAMTPSKAVSLGNSLTHRTEPEHGTQESEDYGDPSSPSEAEPSPETLRAAVALIKAVGNFGAVAHQQRIEEGRSIARRAIERAESTQIDHGPVPGSDSASPSRRRKRVRRDNLRIRAPRPKRDE